MTTQGEGLIKKIIVVVYGLVTQVDIVTLGFLHTQQILNLQVGPIQMTKVWISLRVDLMSKLLKKN